MGGKSLGRFHAGVLQGKSSEMKLPGGLHDSDVVFAEGDKTLFLSLKNRQETNPGFCHSCG